MQSPKTFDSDRLVGVTLVKTVISSSSTRGILFVATCAPFASKGLIHGFPPCPLSCGGWSTLLLADTLDSFTFASMHAAGKKHMGIPFGPLIRHNSLPQLGFNIFGLDVVCTTEGA